MTDYSRNADGETLIVATTFSETADAATVPVRSLEESHMGTERLRYRLLTGTDDRAFCERVSEALADGYQLYGSPAVTFDGEKVVTAQAVILDAGES